MKYTKFFSLFFLLCALNQSLQLKAAFNSDTGLDIFADAMEDVQHEDMQSRAIDPNLTFTLMTDDAIRAQDVLKDDFYLTTAPPRTRSILDLDWFQFPNNFPKGWTYIPFYTQTTEMQFRGDKTALNQYINLKQNSVCELIERIDDKKFTAFDLDRILSLFRNTKMQERRLGIMFNYGCEIKNWDLYFQVPLMLQERNFFMTESEREALKKEDFFKVENEIEYFRQHLISDKFGFGDFKISAEYLVKETHKQFMHFGVDITLPTSLPLVKGLVGTHFDRKKANPEFSFQTLLDLGLDDAGASETEANSAAVKELMEQFVNDVTDRLSTVVLERKLGDERHLKCGFYVRNQLNFTPDCYLTTKNKIELSLPASERRFFRIKPNSAEIDAIAASNPITDDEALVQLNLLSNKFIDQLFPPSYRVSVFPGCSLQSTAQLTYERPHWTARLGTDAWYHTKEVLGTIEASESIRNTLDIEAARKKKALQTRIWIGLDRAHQDGARFDWGVRASYAGFSYGVGQEFALSLQLAYNF